MSGEKSVSEQTGKSVVSRELLQQALDALRQCEFTSPPAQRPIVKDAITALREALAAPMPEPWMPIETAPKDEIVLVAAEFDCPGDWRIKCGYLSEEMGLWRVWGASWKPTHWMPLPPAPGAAPPAAPIDSFGGNLDSAFDAPIWEQLREIGQANAAAFAAIVPDEGIDSLGMHDAAVKLARRLGYTWIGGEWSAAPVAREPLSQVQTDEIWDRFEQAPTMSYRYLVTCAIEKAHGISTTGGVNG